MLARWAMLIVASRLPYLRTSGSGSTLLSGKISGARTAVVAIFTLVVMLILGELHAIAVSIAVAIGIVFAMRSFYRRWLGGVTGDLIGACGELVEIAILVTMAS
jgi:adenosylcobinamide-GDP ribazoletransferase